MNNGEIGLTNDDLSITHDDLDIKPAGFAINHGTVKPGDSTTPLLVAAMQP